MTNDVSCHVCTETVDIRGYSGHLRMAHPDLSEPERRDYVEHAKSTGDASDGGNGVEHASQIEGAHTSDEETLCPMCGRHDPVNEADTVGQMLINRGASQIPEELHEYGLFCVDCEYAFDGDET